MKKLYKYIVLVIGIVTFFSCADEELVGSFGETGSDVILKLSFQTETNKNVVISRTEADETEADEKLYDLHFYVFDEDNNLTGYEQVVSGDGNIPSTGPYDIKIRTKTGTSYIYAIANINTSTTYFLDEGDAALLKVTNNPTTSINGTTINIIKDYKEGESTLKEIVDDAAKTLTREKLQSIQFKRNHATSDKLFSPTPSGNIHIMSGYVNDGESVDIIKTGFDGEGKNIGTIKGADKIIKLYRILAENTLNISSVSKTGTFTPVYFKLCNVPKVGKLIPKDYIGTTRVDNITDYVNNQYFLQKGDNQVQVNVTTLKKDDVESDYRENFGKPNNGVYTIKFHYPENLQVPNGTVEDKIGENYKYDKWKHRETNSYDSGIKGFTNAPASGAYLEIYGDYKSNDGSEVAQVTYTIHLGNFSNPANRKSLFDYNVIRNYSYIYNVQVNGVEDIRVEAQTNTGHDNPYAEGLIVNTSSGIPLTVDAHFESRVLTFRKSEIEALKKQGLGYFVNIKTPFGTTEETVYVKDDGIYRVGVADKFCSIAEAARVYQIRPNDDNATSEIDSEGETEEENTTTYVNEADYEWIKFVKNTSGNQVKGTDDISKYPCVYPGDYKIVDGKRVKGNWLNVFELLAELYYTQNTSDDDQTNNEPDVYGEDGVVYYTCFIDENYYENKPWPKYVNQPKRTMLIANDLDISSDGKSIFANVKYSISQHSITTFYKTEYKIGSRDVYAFGTETIDEEDIYGSRFDTSVAGTIRYPNNKESAWSAHSSAVATYTHSDNNNWYTNIHNNWSVIRNNVPQPLYNTVAKACMSRNRDLNGDGIITNGQDINKNNTIDPEEREVRWYLADIDQYRGLFIGQSSFVGNEEAYLISTDEILEIDDAKRNELFKIPNNWGGESNDEKGHWYRRKYHYFTSSSGDNKTFWPEEGLTNNPMHGMTAYSQWSWAELVRCVRTLESGGIGDKNAEKYYKYADNKFEMLGIKETRQFTNVSQEDHNEIQAPNNLSGGFIVAGSDLQLTKAVDGYYGREYEIGDSSFDLEDVTGLNPDYLGKNGGTLNLDAIPNKRIADFCENYNGERGWRTPNQKELALMLSEGCLNDNTHYASRSRFSGCDKDGTTNDENFGTWHNTAGIWVKNNSSLNVGTGYENGVKIRCVKDVQ